MKRQIILILLVMLVLIFKLNALDVKASYTDNGHDNIEYVDFYSTGGFLLCDTPARKKQKSNEYLSKSKFFGWKTYYYNTNELASYTGETVFLRTNATNQDVKFSFSLKETKTEKRSITVSNSIVAKGSGGKKITASLQDELEVEISNESTYSVVESLDYSIVVPKGKRIEMYTYGECVVSNGVSSYFAFWIKTKTGSWEIIDIKTIYYKLEETAI